MSCMLVIAMKLAHPMQSVIPSAHGAMLGVHARTTEPLGGRQVATLTRPRFSQSRVNIVLGELAGDGIVQVDVRPPASYYRLNRDHVAASGVLALSSMWQTLLNRIRASVTEWSTQPIAAWIFGSAARAEADSDSDLDILVVCPDQLPHNDSWQKQLDDLADDVHRWSGNPCEPLVITGTELKAAVQRDDRIVDALRRDAIHLVGARPHALLGRRAS